MKDKNGEKEIDWVTKNIDFSSVDYDKNKEISLGEYLNALLPHIDSKDKNHYLWLFRSKNYEQNILLLEKIQQERCMESIKILVGDLIEEKKKMILIGKFQDANEEFTKQLLANYEE